MCFDFVYKFCLKNLLLWEEFQEMLSQMYVGRRIKYPFF